MIASFLAGVYWSRHESSRNYAIPIPVERPPELLANRYGHAKTEPEDFFPVAEFRQQSALLLGCYQQLNTDPQLYIDIARAIGDRTPLFGLVANEGQARLGIDSLVDAGLPPDAIRFLTIPANTIWIRDFMPFCIRRQDNSISLIDARYIPVYGGEEIRAKDDEMVSAIASLLGLPIRSMPLVVEGGNVLSNGDGTLLTTFQVLEVNQGYEFTKKQVTDIFSDMLGARRWSYVPMLEGEPTGHIDMFATFLAKNILVVAQIDEAYDPINHERLENAAKHFSSITTSLGPMRIFRIPMPPRWGEDWRSYTNIILSNGILLMPSFSDVDPELEDSVERLYQTLLPAWEIKRINCDRLVKEQGQLHCMSYSLPQYVSLDGLRAAAYPVPSDVAAPDK